MADQVTLWSDKVQAAMKKLFSSLCLGVSACNTPKCNNPVIVPPQRIYMYITLPEATLASSTTPMSILIDFH